MILLTGTDKTIKACKYCGNNPALRKDSGFYEIACEYYHCNNPMLVFGKDLDGVIDKWNEYISKGDKE